MRNDKERLMAFCQLVDDAISRRAIQGQTITAHWNLHFGEDTNDDLSFDIELGDNEDLRSLLLDFRRFLADNDDVYFSKIANILERTVMDTELHEANRQNREAWKRVLKGGSRVVINGQAWTSRTCFDIMVNGKWFHGDADKAAQFDQLPEMLKGLVLANVNALVIKGLEVLYAERNLIEEAFTRDAVQC